MLPHTALLPHTHKQYVVQTSAFIESIRSEMYSDLNTCWTKHSHKHTHRWRLTVFLPQGTDFHPKYTGENLTCTVQGLKRSTQYKFRVSDDYHRKGAIIYYFIFVDKNPLKEQRCRRLQPLSFSTLQTWQWNQSSHLIWERKYFFLCSVHVCVTYNMAQHEDQLIRFYSVLGQIHVAEWLRREPHWHSCPTQVFWWLNHLLRVYSFSAITFNRQKTKKYTKK